MNTDASAVNNNQKPDRRFPPYLILLAIGSILVISAIILYPAAQLRMGEHPSPEPSAAGLTPEVDYVQLSTTETSSPLASITPIPNPSSTPVIIKFPSQFGTFFWKILKKAHIAHCP